MYQQLALQDKINFAKKKMSTFNQSKAINEDVMISQSSNQIQSVLNQKITELQQALKCGNYVKADELKAEIQKLKNDLKQKKLQEMIISNKREKKNLQHDQQNQITHLIELWNKKIYDFNCQKSNYKKQIITRHEEQILKARQIFEAQISNRMKESSECLNLRKIQEQMKKQKKYSEAHQIQQQVLQMEKKEKILFEKQRQVKIQTALGTLKSKQKIEIEAINKKIESGQKQLLKEKDKQLQKIKLKNMNSMKDLLSLQEKNILGQKGHLKSRAMLSSCRSRSKYTSLKKF